MKKFQITIEEKENEANIELIETDLLSDKSTLMEKIIYKEIEKILKKYIINKQAKIKDFLDEKKCFQGFSIEELTENLTELYK